MFMNENRILIEISLRRVPMCLIYKMSKLAQVRDLQRMGHHELVIRHQNSSPGGRFKNTYELLNQRALKFSYVNKIHIF